MTYIIKPHISLYTYTQPLTALSTVTNPHNTHKKRARHNRGKATAVENNEKFTEPYTPVIRLSEANSNKAIGVVLQGNTNIHLLFHPRGSVPVTYPIPAVLLERWAYTKNVPNDVEREVTKITNVNTQLNLL